MKVTGLDEGDEDDEDLASIWARLVLGADGLVESENEEPAGEPEDGSDGGERSGEEETDGGGSSGQVERLARNAPSARTPGCASRRRTLARRRASATITLPRSSSSSRRPATASRRRTGPTITSSRRRRRRSASRSRCACRACEPSGRCYM